MICPSCGHDNVPGNETCGRCQQSLTPLDQPAPANKIERSLMEVPVSALPTKPVITVSKHTPIAEAIDLMLRHKVGAVLVIDEQGDLIGIFGEPRFAETRRGACR